MRFPTRDGTAPVLATAAFLPAAAPDRYLGAPASEESHLRRNASAWPFSRSDVRYRSPCLRSCSINQLLFAPLRKRESFRHRCVPLAWQGSTSAAVSRGRTPIPCSKPGRVLHDPQDNGRLPE